MGALEVGIPFDSLTIKVFSLSSTSKQSQVATNESDDFIRG